MTKPPGWHHTEETKRRLRELQLKRDPATRLHSEATKLKMSKSAKRAGTGTFSRTRLHRQAYRRRALGTLNPFFGRQHSKATKLIISQHQKELWQDPAYKLNTLKAQLEARSEHPNQLEAKVLKAIEEYQLPYKYNGDGNSLIIDGLVPDFINTNSQKIVIEAFGNYFHSPEMIGKYWRGSEAGRIAAFSSLGFRCLVLWESDVKTASPEQIAQWIRDFENKEVKEAISGYRGN